MSGIVDVLLGAKKDDNAALIRKQLEASEKANRTAYATQINQEADVDQQLARSRRTRGGRSLLEYLDGSATLG